MIIFFIESLYTSKSLYLEVDPNNTIFDVLKKHKLIDLEHLERSYKENKKMHCYDEDDLSSIEPFDIYLKNHPKLLVKNYDMFKSFRDNNIKEYTVLKYTDHPFEMMGGGFLDNIKDEIDYNIGFDLSLIKRDELNVNLIHFDKNMTNSENYGYFNNFKVDVVGGFYAIDDIDIFRKYLEKIKRDFIVVCSGSAAKDIIPICKNYSNIKEVIIFCMNRSYHEHYIKDYPGFVKKVLTSIDSVYEYIKSFGDKYKDRIDLDNSLEKYEKYHFSSDDISMKRQYLQCPVITAEEYDRCYFLVHRAYAHFFDDIDNIYEKPKFIYQNFNKIIDCINKLGKDTDDDLYKQFQGLLNLNDNNQFIEKAIREYTKESDFCYLLNKMMRNFESGLISLAYYMGPFLYGLNKYVKENPDFSMSHDMTLYRKFDCSKLDFYLYKINKGHIICFPSITSTSSQDGSFTPTGYGSGNNSEEKITIKLIIKYKHEYGNKSPGIIVEDKKGKDGHYLSEYTSEHEVILFPFTFMRINDISGNNIYLEIINRKSYIEYTLKNDVHNRKKFSD